MNKSLETAKVVLLVIIAGLLLMNVLGTQNGRAIKNDGIDLHRYSAFRDEGATFIVDHQEGVVEVFGFNENAPMLTFRFITPDSE